MFARVCAEAAGALSKPDPLGAVLAPIAGLTVDLRLMSCDRGAVQSLPAGHAEEAGLVETPSVALDFFRVVDCLFAGSAFCSSTPVRHLEDFLTKVKSACWVSVSSTE